MLYHLVISEILGLFLNTLTVDDKYSLHDSEDLGEPSQMQLSKNKNNFHNFFLHFSNFHKILNIFKQMIPLTGYVFPKLQTVKVAVR